jgi:hypothetical protein
VHRDEVWRHQADMGRSLFARHMRISEDISRGAWSIPRRADPGAFGVVSRHVAAAVGTKSGFYGSASGIADGASLPWVTSHRADAYNGQIGNGICIVPAFGTRRVSRGSEYGVEGGFFARLVIRFVGWHQADMG